MSSVNVVAPAARWLDRRRLAVDERRLHARVGRKGMARPDGEVGVLPDVDRAEAVVEAELLRAIERAEFQRFFFR